MGRLSAQAQAFQGFANAAYEDRCTIRRVSRTKGTDMGNVLTETVIASGVPCRLRPSSASEREIASATEAAVAYTLRVPYWHEGAPVAIDSTCTVLVEARESVPSQVLSVVAPLPSSGTQIDFVATKQG